LIDQAALPVRFFIFKFVARIGRHDLEIAELTPIIRMNASDGTWNHGTVPQSVTLLSLRLGGQPLVDPYRTAPLSHGGHCGRRRVTIRDLLFKE
jgi:hypothetical protein